MRTTVSRSPNSSTTAISGIVVDAATNGPLAGAIVTVTLDAQGRSIVSQLTDTKGRFVFADLSPGGVGILRVFKSGYLDADSSFKTWPSRIVLREGKWIRDIRVGLSRPGGIDGMVINEIGEPAADIWVRAFRTFRLLGRDHLAVTGMTKTDDRGRYRFAGLAPGGYVVQVPNLQHSSDNPQSVVPHYAVPPPPSNATVFKYPPTHSASLTLLLGEQRGGVNLTLEPIVAFRVSGVVVGASKSWRGLALRLLSRPSDGFASDNVAATTLVGTDDRFEFAHVPSGVYTLDATSSRGELKAEVLDDFQWARFSPFVTPSSGTVQRSVGGGSEGLRFAMTTIGSSEASYWARQTIVVGADETRVTVTMRETGLMRGRIVKDLVRGAKVPDLEPSVGIQLDPANGSPSLGWLRSDSEVATADEQFSIYGILPGKYFLRVANGWILKSASWNGRDYADSPFDADGAHLFDDVQVVVTNAGSSITGAVRDDRGVPISAGAVLIFPASRALWEDRGLWPPKTRSVDLNDEGEFAFNELPAGDYYLVASNESSLDAHGQERLELLRQFAQLVSVSWGQAKTVNLVFYPQAR